MQKINLAEELEVSGPGSFFLDDSIATVEEMIKSADLIDKLPFLDLRLLRKFKLKKARPKDLVDINLIDNFLKT